MRSYARKRDVNERPIVDALRAAGATVQQLDGTGVPDLLVGFAGKTWLVEVKEEHGQAQRKGRVTESGLRESQESWWKAWRGGPLVTVCTVDEALAVIGVSS